MLPCSSDQHSRALTAKVRPHHAYTHVGAISFGRITMDWDRRSQRASRRLQSLDRVGFRRYLAKVPLDDLSGRRLTLFEVLDVVCLTGSADIRRKQAIGEENWNRFLMVVQRIQKERERLSRLPTAMMEFGCGHPSVVGSALTGRNQALDLVRFRRRLLRMRDPSERTRLIERLSSALCAEDGIDAFLSRTPNAH